MIISQKLLHVFVISALVTLLQILLDKVIKKALSKNERATTTKSSYSDLVTETDHKVEKILIHGLKETYPDHRLA